MLKRIFVDFVWLHVGLLLLTQFIICAHIIGFLGCAVATVGGAGG